MARAPFLNLVQHVAGHLHQLYTFPVHHPALRHPTDADGKTLLVVGRSGLEEAAGALAAGTAAP